MDEEKKKALESALKQIEKNIGKGAIMRLGEREISVSANVIPTGSLSLDIALGIGGIPRGRIVEIFGPEASGKTTLALHLIAEAQRAGGVAAFIDAEHAIDPDYSKRIGIDIDNLLIAQPDTGEEALEIAENLTRSGAVDIIVIDSVAALVPRAEIEGTMGDSHMGLQARLMSQALRKLTGTLSKSKTCAVFINQIRHKIGIVYGSPITTPGGLALKFHSSVRIEIKRVTQIKKGEEIIGGRTLVRVVKNKLAPPFKDAEFDIIYGEGISKEGDILDLAVENGIITKSGVYFSYKDEKLGQGRQNAVDFLKENRSVYSSIEQELRKKLGLIKDENLVKSE